MSVATTRRFAVRRSACLLIACALWAAAAPGQPLDTRVRTAEAPAQTAGPTGPLTLSRAITFALAHNPDLIASAYELKVADARQTQAAVRPNPDIALEWEDFAGTGAARAVEGLKTTLSLSQVIELGGKRNRRIEVAGLDREVAGVDRQARQLDVLAEVTRRFVTVASSQERQRLTQEATAIAQRTLEAITTRVRAARSPEAERSRALIALTRAQVQEKQAASEFRSARQTLAASFGTTEVTFTEVAADLFKLEAVDSFEMLVARLERNPDFVRFASAARLRDAEVRLAQAQARPNLTFSAGIRRLNDSRDMALIAGFSMALPIFDRNQGGIREAQERRSQTGAEQQAAFVRARAMVYSLYEELLSARNRYETLRADALPQAERALEQTQYGYDRGRFSYLELATAQQDLLTLRGEIIDAAADYHRVLAEIERLTGEAVAGAGQTVPSNAVPSTAEPGAQERS